MSRRYRRKAERTKDTTDDDEAREFLELVGMAGLLRRRLDAFKSCLKDDMHLRDIIDRAALVYGRGDPSAAAFWLPTMTEQARWLGLFDPPLAPTPSVALSSSSALAH